MIFISKNENGEVAHDLVMDGTKTVTRRMNPVEVGKTRAVQPGRGKFAVGRVLIKSCEPHVVWYNKMRVAHGLMIYGELEKEAIREGFYTWGGLMSWFREHKIDINDTYRIEVELEKEE